MVRPLDETVTVSGEGRIAENSGVVNRINSVQAAWDHTRYAATVAIRPSQGRSGAENEQGGGDCKRYESHLSTHGFLLLLRDTDSMSGFNARKSFVATSSSVPLPTRQALLRRALLPASLANAPIQQVWAGARHCHNRPRSPAASLRQRSHSEPTA
jgi:hypothetical protein